MSAGEASGDRLGGALAAELRRRRPDLHIAGIGKEAMQNAGVEIIAPSDALSVVGHWDVLGRLPKILALRRRFLAEIRRRQPRLFIGIDAPDFNLGVAAKARGWGIKTAQYVSPSVWMWRGGRTEKISRAADEIWCLFPFEPAAYSGSGAQARFVGHPDAARAVDKTEARRKLQTAPDEKLIALLPGSRDSELRMHLPLFAEVMRAMPGRRFIAAAADENAAAQIRAALPGAQTHAGMAEDILAAADIALVKCGTAVLQAALAQTPAAAVYVLPRMAYFLASRREFRLPFFSLPNILSERFVVPEFIQSEARAPEIAKYLTRLLEDEQLCAAQLDAFAVLRKQLISEQSAADAALEML